MNKIFLLLLLVLSGSYSFAQNGIIKGVVLDAATMEPIPFATVAIRESELVTQSDIDGKFELNKLKPSVYNLQISFVGYKTKLVYELEISNIKPVEVEVLLEEDIKALDEVVIKAPVFSKSDESPVSLRNIGTDEIKRYPGGNRDISKVIQSLPGVASTVSFRNDILIRGGAPSENRFYLDDIEVPTINHFSTQGATGGPVGMLNVDFIRDVNFFTSAFPADKGNALSSVMDIKQINARTDRVGLTFTVGASETALSVEGPYNKKKNATFLMSVRRSYLQFLFKLFELPFMPVYNDVHMKHKIQLDDKNEVSFLFLGALDDFKLNLDANETETQKYLLNSLPEFSQWNYTIGSRYRHIGKNSIWTAVLSRNMLDNRAVKYEGNNKMASLISDYQSQESENKFRLENFRNLNRWKLSYGLSATHACYFNRSFIRISNPYLPAGIDTINYESNLHTISYGAFVQSSLSLNHNKLNVSMGARIDGNSFNKEMRNPLSQFSPRIALSYQFIPDWSLNANAGIYYQLPPYTALGFRDNTQNLVNKTNGLKYIRCTHLVGGIEHYTSWNSKFSVEGFVKYYANSPFQLSDSIALANLGGDYGVVGNTALTSTSRGKAYGAEFLFQQKLQKGFYGIVSYSFYRSLFTDKYGEFVPSSWDNQHVVSITAGKKFKRNWELGLVWKMSGGSPYTPYDTALSSLKAVWDVTQQGIPNYDLLNTERLPLFHQLDVRLSKKFFFKKWNLETYVDIQNMYNFEATQQDYLTLARDEETNEPLTDPVNPAAYQTKLLENKTGRLLPSIGLVIGI